MIPILSTLPIITPPYLQKNISLAVFKDWDEFKTWLKDMDAAVKELFSTTFKGIPHATMITIKSSNQDMAELRHKLYYQEKSNYIEEIRTRFVPQKELPTWARDKLTLSKEIDISEEMAQELDITF